MLPDLIMEFMAGKKAHGVSAEFSALWRERERKHFRSLAYSQTVHRKNDLRPQSHCFSMETVVVFSIR